MMISLDRDLGGGGEVALLRDISMHSANQPKQRERKSLDGFMEVYYWTK